MATTKSDLSYDEYCEIAGNISPAKQRNFPFARITLQFGNEQQSYCDCDRPVLHPVRFSEKYKFRSNTNLFHWRAVSQRFCFTSFFPKSTTRQTSSNGPSPIEHQHERRARQVLLISPGFSARGQHSSCTCTSNVVAPFNHKPCSTRGKTVFACSGWVTYAPAKGQKRGTATLSTRVV